MESQFSFIAAAEGPDDIKRMNWDNLSLLHYLGYPIIKPGFEGKIEIPIDNAQFLYTD